LKCCSPTKWKALFNMFIEHQLKRVLKQNCVCSFLALTMHCTSSLHVKIFFKNEPNNWKRKILIPFIILGARPTSTPSPKRDQLVVLCYSNLVSHQSGCCFLSLPFRLRIYNYFLPWEEDVCVLVNPIKVGNCMVFCYS